MEVGCPAGVLPAEGGGGPDTGVAPLLRLPDPQAVERDREDGRKGTNLEPARGRTRSFLPWILTVAREARGSDSLPQLMAQPFCVEQSTRGKALWTKVTAH